MHYTAELCEFYKDRNIFISGHTGFKGSWLCVLLLQLGANIIGYSLPAEEDELFNLLPRDNKLQSNLGDVRDYHKLQKIMASSKAEIIFHLAAQPLVRVSYENPVYTYETNVMGTVNILEAIRNNPFVKSVVNITTDKVYENREQNIPCVETDILDGYEPYSNSKSCSELITSSFRRSFFSNSEVAISTMRAGNVIGGGDFAKDRIIPDCVRSALFKKEIVLRNPHSIRPYQHVIEPIYAYLVLAMKQFQDKSIQGAYNIGPNEADCVDTAHLTDLFCAYWGDGLKWTHQGTNSVHEASYLRLNSKKIEQTLGISPKWNIITTVEKTVEWYKEFQKNDDIYKCMLKQIDEYLER